MAGVVLETLSNRKLITLGVVVGLLQIIAFLLGGLIGSYFSFHLCRLGYVEPLQILLSGPDYYWSNHICVGACNVVLYDEDKSSKNMASPKWG